MGRVPLEKIKFGALAKRTALRSRVELLATIGPLGPRTTNVAASQEPARATRAKLRMVMPTVDKVASPASTNAQHHGDYYCIDRTNFFRLAYSGKKQITAAETLA